MGVYEVVTRPKTVTTARAPLLLKTSKSMSRQASLMMEGILRNLLHHWHYAGGCQGWPVAKVHDAAAACTAYCTACTPCTAHCTVHFNRLLPSLLTVKTALIHLLALSTRYKLMLGMS